MSIDFVQKITEEKKKSRELTFNIYTASCFDEKTNCGTYGFCIVDRYEKKTTIIEKINNTSKSQVELKSILESIKHIINNNENESKQFIQINLSSTSLYSVNIIREWLHKWIQNDEQPEDEQNSPRLIRPNYELLKEIYNLTNLIKLNIKLIQKSNNEIIWSLDRKTNEKLFE
jgi:ribonuclease HI